MHLRIVYRHILTDQWRYFAPVKEGMPANCSKDINRVVQHVDEVGQTGSDEEKAQLKKMFGLEDLEHFDDFAGYVNPT